MCGQNFPLNLSGSMDAEDREFMERIDLNSLIDIFDREQRNDQTSFSDVESELGSLVG